MNVMNGLRLCQQNLLKGKWAIRKAPLEATCKQAATNGASFDKKITYF
jgi:hypothetical protein